jgi:hypothetical protein
MAESRNGGERHAPHGRTPAKCLGPGRVQGESQAHGPEMAGPPALWRWPCLARKLACPCWSRCCRGASIAARGGGRVSWRWPRIWPESGGVMTRPARIRCWPRSPRGVNDRTSDAGRAALAGLVPSVIGLAGEDLHIDARIALLCARTALPGAAATTQQVMALSVLACERVLAALDGRSAGWTSRARPRWRTFRWPPSGPAASPAAPRPHRRCSAGTPRPPRCTPR